MSSSDEDAFKKPRADACGFFCHLTRRQTRKTINVTIEGKLKQKTKKAGLN